MEGENMPNLKRCEAGIHTYDHDKHVQCPYCGVSSLMPNTEKYDPQKQGGTAFDDNKTKAYDASSATQAYRPDGAGARPANDPSVTQGLWQKKHGIDPVVGWLVCIAGPDKGRDYRIRSGWNDIGRSPNSAICIAGDESISRDEHAKLFFDPKQKGFHLASASGRAGIYVNGSAVLQTVTLSPYDMVELGGTQLLFVPFCGGSFSWE
jgi:hypothetical protein